MVSQELPDPLVVAVSSTFSRILSACNDSSL
jgi:hypothetical protein